MFSLPHGNVGDKVLEGLMPNLSQNDIILDCGNEHFENTERRQEKCKKPGIRYIGCGVSGGYQAARAGPSMCPGGDQSALKEVLPLLQKVAAKDKNGKPCVGAVGSGGCGHYVKMMHNGIEHGMMSAISEAWGIMRKMGLAYEEIGDVFAKWNDSGELVSEHVAILLISTFDLAVERNISCFDRSRPFSQARVRLFVELESRKPPSRHF